MVAVLEASAVSLMLFGVMPSLPPVINLLIVSGLFSVQGIRNLLTLICDKSCFCRSFAKKLHNCCCMSQCCHDYLPLDQAGVGNRGCWKSCQQVASALAQLGGVGAQIGGLVSILVLLIVKDREWRWLGTLVLVSCMLISFCWCDKVQRSTFTGKSKKSKSYNTATGNSLEKGLKTLPTARLTTSKSGSNLISLTVETAHQYKAMMCSHSLHNLH